LLRGRNVQVKGAISSESTTRRVARISSQNLDKRPVRHVLVADADAASRAQREQQLLAAGLRVSVARTAFEAIVKACCLVPDLILLDASLTDIEPSETGQFLTLCPVTAHIPVVRLTRGRRVPQRVLAGARAGALAAALL
jgi:PleD family two-component response regulator